MPNVYPFKATRFRTDPGVADVSALVAPPYDVLDAPAKARLLSRSASNIVAIDLPHIPAKELGPPECYQYAGATLHQWLARGVLVRDAAPAMFVYRQSFTSQGITYARVGMACTIDLLPFGARSGGGVLPHEETFSGPKQDRLALMRATRAQLSPIFALHVDDDRAASDLLAREVARRAPDAQANLGDGVLHEVWRIGDPSVIGAYQRVLRGKDAFIADGHHRYTTSLNYLRELEAQGPVPADHPARRCLCVLVGMNDPGLVIWPTHRVLGGMKNYTAEKFLAAARERLRVEPVQGGLRDLEHALAHADHLGSPRVGAMDIATGACMLLAGLTGDPLQQLHSYKPKAWRELDVALVQHLIVEDICQPLLNEGCGVRWAFPHTLIEVEGIAAGHELGSGGGQGFTPQLALIVRPTPLSAVREVSLAGDLMPQKSTFFYPKLATGLFIHELDQ